jgi:hypothetical protein
MGLSRTGPMTHNEFVETVLMDVLHVSLKNQYEFLSNELMKN